jgi:hypothetical protein
LEPENGKSLIDDLQAEQSGQMRDDAAQNGEGYKITPVPAAALAVNAQDGDIASTQARRRDNRMS